MAGLIEGVSQLARQTGRRGECDAGMLSEVLVDLSIAVGRRGLLAQNGGQIGPIAAEVGPGGRRRRRHRRRRQAAGG